MNTNFSYTWDFKHCYGEICYWHRNRRETLHLGKKKKIKKFAAYLKSQNNRSFQNTLFLVSCKLHLDLHFKDCLYISYSSMLVKSPSADAIWEEVACKLNVLWPPPQRNKPSCTNPRLCFWKPLVNTSVCCVTVGGIQLLKTQTSATCWDVIEHPKCSSRDRTHRTWLKTHRDTHSHGGMAFQN